MIASLEFLDRITKLEDNSYRQRDKLDTLIDKERDVQTLAEANYRLKLSINAFRKTHASKLETLREKLGIKATSSQFEQIIKSKPGSREY